MNYIDANFDDIANGDFKLFNGNPIVRSFGGSPIIADPSVLTPKDSHDGLWHLFCHTLFGVYHFDSKDGVNWTKRSKVVPRAMRADCNYIDGTYYLYYERTQPLLIKAFTLFGGKWKSHIYLTTSKDLKSWTEPTLIIDNVRDYMSDSRGVAISNPFLTKFGDKYRLYFSAGQTFIKDCGFSEPTYISYAESDSLSNGFTPLEKPILSPDANNPYLNLCSGCIKVYQLNDCYIGLQNGIYRRDGKSHSSIMLLRSNDGKSFEFVKVFLDPTVTEGKNKNWMKQYVYACNLVKCDNGFRLYFNARDYAASLRGREHIGVFYTGEID